MRILVDADACPVVDITEQLARKYALPLLLFSDTAHVLHSGYAELHTVGKGADAVDFALTTACRKGDIVVTQDFGVAAMTLGKGAFGIHQSGKWYTDENIDLLLQQRYEAKKARMSKSRHHLKGPAKRTPEDDERFRLSLEKLILKAMGENKP